MAVYSTYRVQSTADFVIILGSGDSSDLINLPRRSKLSDVIYIGLNTLCGVGIGS
jgi:hypothetical protein